MRGWKFWEKGPSEAPTASPEPEAPRRFSARPRTDLIDPARVADPAKADQLIKLRKRREAVLFDVERAEQATEHDNPWRARALLLDDALESARMERVAAAAARSPAGAPLPPTPIYAIAFDEGPPPSVRFTIAGEAFLYAEELDWAERGFQIARSELIRQSGDPASLVPSTFPAEQADAVISHLEGSLFVFASDLRDRALSGEAFPTTPGLSDLARPSTDEGGWLDWAGHAPARIARELRLSELDAEIERLASERARELDEMHRWAERLPIALRRLADVEAEIAALGG